MLRKLVLLLTMASMAAWALAASAGPDIVPGEAAGTGQTPTSDSRCLLPDRPQSAVTPADWPRPKLGYAIATVGALSFSGQAFGLLPDCGPEFCQSVLLLGFRVPAGAPSHADLMLRLSGAAEDLDVEVAVFAADSSSPEPFPIRASEDELTGELMVMAPGLPIGDPLYLACGLLEIQLSLVIPFEPPNPVTGSDSLVLREVTLGPGSG
ncbi:MAG: hypothetical protein AAFY88_03170 [Acidobacteriota bacterium]